MKTAYLKRYNDDVTAYVVDWSSDSSGDFRLRPGCDGMPPLPDGEIDRAIAIGSSADPPDALYDVTLDGPQGVDQAEGALLNLAATSEQRGVSRQAEGRLAPLRTDLIRVIRVSNAGASNEGRLVLYVLTHSAAAGAGAGGASAGANASFIFSDASAGATTVTLPAAASGLRITVKKVDTSGNTVTIETPGSETIDGSTNLVITDAYASVDLTSDGTNWFII